MDSKRFIIRVVIRLLKIPFIKKLFEIDLYKKGESPVLLKRLLYLKRILTMGLSRYQYLLKTIYEERCRSIMEIGTYKGLHASQMIETANIFHPMDRIEYYGFDLFEDLSDEDFQKEFAKRPPAYNEVKQRLEKTGAKIHLYMGDSKDTLSKFIEESKGGNQIDLVFIDGGHSIETITSDWNCVKRIMNYKTVVIFDDYYNNTEPELEGLGCQSIIKNLDENVYDIEILEPEDNFEKQWGTLRVNLVKVRLKRA